MSSIIPEGVGSSESKPENGIPNWFCPYKIPTEFAGSLSPLVYLAGLNVEKNVVHRGIWEMIKLKPSSKDFQPTYVDVPLEHKFPVKKQKNDQIETYVPRGVLKSNWLNKHLQLIPSVVVTFFDMNWTDPYWNDKKNECAKRVRELKADLAVHGCQILVMLIKTADAGEDNFSTDRASALCAAADIPPKALYILSHTHSERIQACVQRLEIGMKEASKVYYSGRIRRVKNWKDRTQDLALLARYNFKTGFFQEIRRDYMSAISHYHAAHEMLRTMKVTESNVQQIRCVSSWLCYRICRLNLLKMDYKESQLQFEKHIRAFRNMEGNRELVFEQLAWLQNQYSVFGELLRHFYKAGFTALDPVTYFLTAVDYSEKRVHHCKEHLLNAEVIWPVEMNEYKKDCDVEYVGQRPWRQDAFGPDTVFVPEDSNAIQALKYFELQYKHSADRITHLGIASDFCRDHQRMRTRCQLMMMMGIEFFAEAEYHRAIILMAHVLREFGRDKGTVLLYLVAECGLRAACCDGDVSSYLSFLVFLLKRDFDDMVSNKRRELLWCKLLAVLDKRIPMAEQGCTPNEDKWTAALATPFQSFVGVHRECIIDAVFYFNSETFRAATPAEVKVVLINKVDFPIPITKFGVVISITEYNSESKTDIILAPDETRELSLFFTPTLKDVGKIIQIHMGYIDIGKPDASIVLHYAAVMGISPYLWNDGKKEKGKQIIAKIEPMVPLLRPKITRDDPMLVNEWHKVLVSWTNTDSFEYTKVHVNILLATSDPSDLVLSTNPHVPGKYGSLTHSVEMERLEPNASIDSVVYIKCAKPKASEIQILTKAKYVDHTRQAVVNELMEPVELVKPFEISQKFRNLETDELGSVLPNEEFVLYFTMKNAAKTLLNVLSAKISNLVPAIQPTVNPTLELNNVMLQEGEMIQLVNSLILTAPAEGALGCLEICWKRDSEPSVPACTTVIGISPILLSTTAAIYVEGIFNYKGRGELKKPMPVKFSIHNRSVKAYDLWISLESTESFMNAGPKKTNIKIMAQESVDMHYILFPLKTGLLKTPRLMIDNAHTFASGDTQLDIPSIVHKNIVKYVFVARGDDENVQPEDTL